MFYNFRPDFLRNEETGKNLELDIFYPDLKLAIEVNGFTHELRDIKERDKFKKIKCEKNGIKYIGIYNIGYLVNLRKELREFLGEKLNFKRQIPLKLWNKIKKYRPNKKTLGRKGKAILYKIQCEKATDIQQSEIEFNRKKMEIRLQKYGEKGIKIREKRKT